MERSNSAVGRIEPRLRRKEVERIKDKEVERSQRRRAEVGVVGRESID